MKNHKMEMQVDRILAGLDDAVLANFKTPDRIRKLIADRPSSVKFGPYWWNIYLGNKQFQEQERRRLFQMIPDQDDQIRFFSILDEFKIDREVGLAIFERVPDLDWFARICKAKAAGLSDRQLVGLTSFVELDFFKYVEAKTRAEFIEAFRDLIEPTNRKDDPGRPS